VTTDQKGAIAEAAIALAAMKLGLDVYRPLCEGGRYDLILDLGEELLRVQCKWVARRNGVLTVFCMSNRPRSGRIPPAHLLGGRGRRHRCVLLRA
jgi:hypothetical protein